MKGKGRVKEVYMQHHAWGERREKMQDSQKGGNREKYKKVHSRHNIQEIERKTKRTLKKYT